MSVKITFVGSGDAFGSGGRMNTCILVDAPGTRFAIDCGATGLVALNSYSEAEAREERRRKKRTRKKFAVHYLPEPGSPLIITTSHRVSS